MVKQGLESGYIILALPLQDLQEKLLKELDSEGAQLPRLGRELASLCENLQVRNCSF